MMFSHKLLKTQALSSSRSSLNLVASPSFGFARQLNRAEQSARNYKSDPSAYFYQPT